MRLDARVLSLTIACFGPVKDLISQLRFHSSRGAKMPPRQRSRLAMSYPLGSGGLLSANLQVKTGETGSPRTASRTTDSPSLSSQPCSD